MRIRSVVTTLFLLGGLPAYAAADSRVEVALLLGSTSATNEQPALQFDRGTTYQATFGWAIWRRRAAQVALDVPVIASPAFTVVTPGASLPLEYASLYLTPGIRVSVAPARRCPYSGRSARDTRATPSPPCARTAARIRVSVIRIPALSNSAAASTSAGWAGSGSDSKCATSIQAHARSRS